MLPPLKDTTANGLTFKDLETLEDRTQASVYGAEGRKHLLALIARTRQTKLCDVDNVSRQTRAAWETAKALNPRLTFSEFSEMFTPELDNSDFDSRLGNLSLGVWERGAFIGVFFLYNVSVTSEDASRIQVNAYPAPAIDFVNSETWAHRVFNMLTAFLDSELELADGRKLNLTEWKFPTSRDDHSWISNSGPWTEHLFNNLNGDSAIQVENRDGKLRRIRRDNG